MPGIPRLGCATCQAQPVQQVCGCLWPAGPSHAPAALLAHSGEPVLTGPSAAGAPVLPLGLQLQLQPAAAIPILNLYNFIGHISLEHAVQYQYNSGSLCLTC